KIVPDHLNWYGNMKDYVSDKQLIYADQTSQDFSIFDYDDDEKELNQKTHLLGEIYFLPNQKQLFCDIQKILLQQKLLEFGKIKMKTESL
ncbi:MAG: hypothetical protein J6R03_05240, partial [Treponema sp.]|nr:hypothetical protein [Treponema sp.]